MNFTEEQINTIRNIIDYCRENDQYWIFNEKKERIDYINLASLHKYEIRHPSVCNFKSDERFVLWNRFRMAGKANDLEKLCGRIGEEMAAFTHRDILYEGFDPYTNPNYDDLKKK